MLRSELDATAKIGGRVLADVASLVEGVHRAVAERAFGALGPVGRPARVVHDAVATAVYGGVRWSCLGSSGAVGQALLLAGPGSAPAARTRWGNQTVAVLNAFAGDRLARDGNALAIRMAVRADGRDVALDRESLRAAFPDATSRLAILVHGLAETDVSWARATADTSQTDDACGLLSELGYTPVYIRYNSGRHVSENGGDLCELLQGLVSSWPVAPTEVLLVGHSMGGLVIRSACHHAQVEHRSWVDLVRHVVYLGTPHLGAPLARAAGLAGWALSRLPETRPFAPVASGSSDGVKDLRFGYLLEDDWSGCDPIECRRDHRGDVPLLESANHYVFGVTVSENPGSVAGRLVGDLLVQPSSAHGRRRRQHIPFPVDGRRRLGGLNHFDLLHHPAIWREIRDLLTSSR